MMHDSAPLALESLSSPMYYPDVDKKTCLVAADGIQGDDYTFDTLEECVSTLPTCAGCVYWITLSHHLLLLVNIVQV